MLASVILAASQTAFSFNDGISRPANRLPTADGAAGGGAQPVSFGKDKAALLAGRRDNLKVRAGAGSPGNMG